MLRERCNSNYSIKLFHQTFVFCFLLFLGRSNMRQNVALTRYQTNLLLTGFGYQNGSKWTDGIWKRVWIQHVGRIWQGQCFLFFPIFHVPWSWNNILVLTWLCFLNYLLIFLINFTLTRSSNGRAKYQGHGSDSQGMHVLIKCIPWMQCKLIQIKVCQIWVCPYP